MVAWPLGLARAESLRRGEEEEVELGGVRKSGPDTSGLGGGT